LAEVLIPLDVTEAIKKQEYTHQLTLIQSFGNHSYLIHLAVAMHQQLKETVILLWLESLMTLRLQDNQHSDKTLFRKKDLQNADNMDTV